MLVIKYIILGIIFAAASYIGVVISKRYRTRVNELKEIAKALNFFEEKIKFTYEPIPDVFEEISKKLKKNIGEIFLNASKKMENENAGVSWEEAIDSSNTSLTIDDKDIIKGLAKMLGRTDIDGQVSEIRLTCKFIDMQIKEAENEKNKNEKLYKTLGVTVGLAIVIVLI